MKCAVDGGAAMVDCYSLGDGRCVVEGGVVPCPLKKSNTCSTTGGEVCIPTISVHNPEFATIEDVNRDGYICGDEVLDWVSVKYDNAWGNAVFPTCERFDKERAIMALKGLRPEMADLIGRVSNGLFSSCPDGVEAGITKRLSVYISRGEKGILDYTIPAAADRGAGQLGLSWNAITGEIVALRSDSDGAKGGLKVGDKIISVDGFKYTDTVDYKAAIMSQFFQGFLTLLWPDLHTYDSLKKAGVPANSLFFGPCGSTAKVEIERNGVRQILEIKRGRG